MTTATSMRRISLYQALSIASSSGKTGRNKLNETEAMVELIMKRMNQVFKPPPKPMRCEVCGGDHPTSQCLPPRQNPQPYRAPPRIDKWCDFENKWTNHETAECYHRIRYLREQGMATASSASTSRARIRTHEATELPYSRNGTCAACLRTPATSTSRSSS